MNNKFKEIGTKNNTYYLFDNIINIKNFVPNKIKTDKKPYKDILIYYIRYVRINDPRYIKVRSANPLYLIINKKWGTLKKLLKANI